MAERQAGRRDHGIHIGWVLALGSGFFLTLAGTVAAVGWLASAWDLPLRGPNAPLDAAIAGPRLESAPQDEWRRYALAKQQQLEGCGRGVTGAVHIPIEAAMARLASGGDVQPRSQPVDPCADGESAPVPPGPSP